MIEHRIKDHPDASLMAKPHQLFGFFQRTESRIDLQIVFGIVLMIGGRGEQRSKIEKRYTQLLEIRNLSVMPLIFPPKWFFVVGLAPQDAKEVSSMT